MARQIFNPYLPSCEYIPDGEPHVFGERLYLYGSHDRFRGAGFCLNDYVCWSADVNDLTDWRYEGVIFRKDQDPCNQNIPADAPPQLLKFGIEPENPEEDLNPRGVHAMWAPDVAQGPDGRYYLFYCMDFLPEIRVAVCDSPAGRYEYLGLVRHPDGAPLGAKAGDRVQFDPGVFMDDDGQIYLYSGNSPRSVESDDGTHRSQVMRLEDDMLTLKEEPRLLLPSVSESTGTGFEGHEFFEASSIRKIGGKYYFVYSSIQSHELNYAVSDRPDAGYVYGGTLVDNADVFLNGRTEAEAINPFGNTHGGIECAAGQWYVFYHRQTNRTNFSRQGCAEKIFFDENGHIAQAEITSCGLNKGPLAGRGVYPANICCHLTGPGGAALHSHPKLMGWEYPFLTQEGGDIQPEDLRMQNDAAEPVQYIRNMKDGATAGYKYFALDGLERIAVELRGEGEGTMEVSSTPAGRPFASIPAKMSSEWRRFEAGARAEDGVSALYFTWRGTGSVDFRRLELE